MRKISLLLVLVSLSILGCKKEVETPKVIYENTSKTNAKPVKVDSSQIAVADLPIVMNGTKYLIHPIGKLQVFTKNDKLVYASTSNNDEVSFRISNNDENEITGFLTNLKFQEIGSDSIKTLTDKPILIETVTYLKSVSDKTKQQILVYTLADMDTNKDGKWDGNDIKTLYLSEINGNRFTKLSSDFQELINWSLVEATNRLYFRTIDDTNKNGQFDKNDVIHYHFVDLNNKDWKVADYNPIGE
jgi:hypothetical protein